MKTIHASKLSKIAMTTGYEKKITTVVMDGEVLHWVGIGWVSHGEAKSPKHDHLPRVRRGRRT